jgi:hypothetical protein
VDSDVRFLLIIVYRSFAYPTEGIDTIWDLGVSLFRERLTKWVEV